MVKPVLVPLLIYGLSHSFISASAHLPLELAVGPVPVCADGGGHVAAHAALGEQLEGGQLLLVQQRVAVVLITHRHGGEELLAAVRAGHAGATRGQVPPVNSTEIRSSSQTQTQTHRSLSSSQTQTHRHTDHCPAHRHRHTDHRHTDQIQQHSTKSPAHRHRHRDHCPAAQHQESSSQTHRSQTHRSDPAHRHRLQLSPAHRHRHTDQIQLTDTDFS